MRNQILDGKIKDSDESLRPLKLSDYIGQDKMKNNLKVFIESAKIRDVPMDHMLFYGPPGLGKTTIAGIIANELDSKMTSVTGPSIEKAGDLVAMLTTLDEGDILFIDEIHRLPKFVEEILYPAMEDFVVDIVINGDSGNSKTLRLDLPKFTLIGATTRVGMLSSPLRDRFGYINKLELYNEDELTDIVIRDAKILNVSLTDDAAKEIGKRSRGTPRIAIRILKRLLDFATVENPKNPMIDKNIADYGMKSLFINDSGLDSNDLNILNAIHNTFKDGPVGLETLAAFISEDEKTIEDMYEPYLMQIGFVSKTPRGRILTEKAIDYLKSIQNN